MDLLDFKPQIATAEVISAPDHRWVKISGRFQAEPLKHGYLDHWQFFTGQPYQYPFSGCECIELRLLLR